MDPITFLISSRIPIRRNSLLASPAPFGDRRNGEFRIPGFWPDQADMPCHLTRCAKVVRATAGLDLAAGKLFCGRGEYMFVAKSWRALVRCTVLVFALSGILVAQAAPWSTEKAATWYEQQPWLVGSNYIPA